MRCRVEIPVMLNVFNTSVAIWLIRYLKDQPIIDLVILALTAASIVYGVLACVAAQERHCDGAGRGHPAGAPGALSVFQIGAAILSTHYLGDESTVDLIIFLQIASSIVYGFWACLIVWSECR